jgi:hypothetical protein
MKLDAAITAVSLLSAATQVLAHPETLSPAEIMRRGTLSKRCAGAAAKLNEKRYNKRMAAKRGLAERSGSTTYTITTEAPYYETIQNDTCVLTHDVTKGPYVWPRLVQLLRR